MRTRSFSTQNAVLWALQNIEPSTKPPPGWTSAFLCFGALKKCFNFEYAKYRSSSASWKFHMLWKPLILYLCNCAAEKLQPLTCMAFGSRRLAVGTMAIVKWMWMIKRFQTVSVKTLTEWDGITLWSLDILWYFDLWSSQKAQETEASVAVVGPSINPVTLEPWVIQIQIDTPNLQRFLVEFVCFLWRCSLVKPLFQPLFWDLKEGCWPVHSFSLLRFRWGFLEKFVYVFEYLFGHKYHLCM